MKFVITYRAQEDLVNHYIETSDLEIFKGLLEQFCETYKNSDTEVYVNFLESEQENNYDKG